MAIPDLPMRLRDRLANHIDLNLDITQHSRPAANYFISVLGNDGAYAARTEMEREDKVMEIIPKCIDLVIYRTCVLPRQVFSLLTFLAECEGEMQAPLEIAAEITKSWFDIPEDLENQVTGLPLRPGSAYEGHTVKPWLGEASCRRYITNDRNYLAATMLSTSQRLCKIWNSDITADFRLTHYLGADVGVDIAKRMADETIWYHLTHPAEII